MKKNYQVGDAFFYNENKDICIIAELNIFSNVCLCWDIYHRSGFNINLEELVPIPLTDLLCVIDMTLEYDDVYTVSIEGRDGNINPCWVKPTDKVEFYEIGLLVFDGNLKLESDYDGIDIEYVHHVQQVNRLGGFDMPLNPNRDSNRLLLSKSFIEVLKKKNLN